MSDLPTPKYRIGDTVYRPQITATTEALPCPDCLGERVWHATTPAGVTHLLECPRCQDRYSIADKLPPLKVQRYVALIEEIRIESVEVRSHVGFRDDQITYMTSTTGSGSVYSERSLYSTKEAAQQAAEIQAALKNTEIDRTAAVLTARRFASIPLAGALQARVRDNLFEAWTACRQLSQAIVDLLPENPDEDGRTKIDAADLRSELDRLERGRKDYPDVYATHPIDALLAALGSGDPEFIAQCVSRLKLMAGILENPS